MPTATRTDEKASAGAAVEEKLERLAECPECLAGSLAWLLSQAHFAMLSEMHRALEPCGVSPRGYHVLVAAETGERTQSELAELVGLDKTTMVVTVDELEKAGFAERIPSETDRRARVIGVTRAGERAVRDARRVIEEIQTGVLGALPSDQRGPFLESLATLVRDRLSDAPDCPGMRKRQPR